MLHWHHSRRQLAVVGSLALATAVCIVIIITRAVLAGRISHTGLVWNLFLAWVPMLAALAAYNSARRARPGWAFIALCATLWLLFFPNAPYILTDMMHLRQWRGIPLWFDLIMFVAFAWTGAFIGLVSLYLMQELIRRAAGVVASWVFAIGALALAGFGVYLGRFPRWNSWDVFVDPFSLLADIWQRVVDPLSHLGTYGFSLLFGMLLISMYVMLRAVMHFQPEDAGG